MDKKRSAININMSRESRVVSEKTIASWIFTYTSAIGCTLRNGCASGLLAFEPVSLMRWNRYVEDICNNVLIVFGMMMLSSVIPMLNRILDWFVVHLQ